MFIELAEFLRCPQGHDPDPYLVLVPDGMTGRHVTTGRVACPACRVEYIVSDGVVRFGLVTPPAPRPLPDAEVIQALLGLGGPGGHVVLMGSAGSLAAPLAAVMAGIHFVNVNPPRDAALIPQASRLEHPTVLPLKTSMARGVVLGAEHCTALWLVEGARILLKGLRLVALAEPPGPVPGVRTLAAEQGMWVGEKRG